MIKQSNEPRELKDRAKKYIVGIIGDLNNRKKKKEKAAQEGALEHQAQGSQADAIERSGSSGKRASSYTSPYHLGDGVVGGEQQRINGVGIVQSLASRSKPGFKSAEFVVED